MFILMKMLARGDVWLAWLALAVSMVAFGLTIEQIAHTGANCQTSSQTTRDRCTT